MRKTTSVLLAAVFAVGVVACGDAHPFTGGALPSNATVYRILPGAGTIVQPGVEAGYGITANLGGSYRLVWTGDTATSGEYRNFYGSVWTPGTFSSIVGGCNSNVCPLESDDVVAAPVSVSGGQRIDFDAMTASGVDGFDFVVSLEPVYFDLHIDGRRYPDLVFFPATDNGGAISSVAAIPFGLTSN